MTHKMYADLLLGCFVFAYAMYVWIDCRRRNKHDSKLNETFNASNHSHLIIDFEKGENNLNNK